MITFRARVAHAAGAALPAAALAAALAAAVACDSSDRLPSVQLGEDPPVLALRPVAGATADEHLYALSLERPGTLLVGSYRVTVHYDTTRLVFVRVSVPDSMLTAANDVGGRVLLAGAAATGFGEGPWVTLVFTPRGTGSAPSPSVELLEIADVQGKDIRPALRAEPARSTAPRQP